MNDYLILGGAGFIGSSLAKYILSQNPYAKISIVDDLSTGYFENIHDIVTNNSAQFFQFKVGFENNDKLETLIQQSNTVIHFAATVGVSKVMESATETILNNLKSTEVVLEYCVKYNKKLFFSSTSECYGKNTTLLSESSDSIFGSKSRWSYAISKLVDEHLILDACKTKNLQAVIFRFFNTVGPDQSHEFGMCIPTFINQAKNGKPITVFKDGKQKRSFTNIRNVTDVLYRLLQNGDSAYGKVINVGNPQEISIKSVAEYINSKFDSKSEIIYQVDKYGKDFEDMERRFPDVSLLESILGKIQWINPIDTIDEIIG